MIIMTYYKINNKNAGKLGKDAWRNLHRPPVAWTQ